MLLLVFTACQIIPETQSIESEPEATIPLPTQHPESTPTNIIITVGVHTATPEIEFADTPITAEYIGVTLYNDIPPGQYLLYYDWDSEVLLLYSENGNNEDIKISDRRGTFSLDGKKFAFITRGNSLVNFDLSDQTIKLVPLSNDCYGFHSWSPEGDRLALYCEGGGIYIYSWEDDTYKHLTNWGHPSVDSFLYPEWSPDGKWIAYAYRQLSSLSLLPIDGVYIIEVDCLDDPMSCQEKTRGPFIPGSDPSTALIAWSPDSRYLAIYHHQQPLRIVDLETGDIRQIELDLERIHGLTWSLDGEWITFNHNKTIYQISPGGGFPSVLAENKGKVISFLNIASISTPSPVSVDLSQSLNELLLTWEDVNQYYQSSETYTYINMFFANEVHNISDLSSDLEGRCRIECTKQIWSTEPEIFFGLDEKEFTYYRKATIMMLRAEDELGAAKAAENLYNEFSPYFETEVDPIEEQYLYQKVSAPEINTRIGMTKPLFDEPGFNIVLTTSTGPITIFVLSYVPPWSDDFTTEVQLAIDFVNSQINKLHESALVP